MLENNCLYCHRSRNDVRVKWLLPLYSWTDGSVEGYFCDQHYYQVKAFNDRQKQAYEEYNRRTSK
ncbi:hypothetical protein OKW24_005727 [Peribacillus simplex]|nr:hypothetical protein [Peribacillus simplex]